MTAAKLALLQPTDGHWPTQLSERLGTSAQPMLAGHRSVGAPRRPQDCPLLLRPHARRCHPSCSRRRPAYARRGGHRHQRFPLADREALPTHPPARQAADHRLSRPRHRGNAHPNRMPRRLRGGSAALPLPLHRATQTRHPGIGASSQRGRRGLADEGFIAHITPGGRTERIAEMLRALGSAVDPERVRVAGSVSCRMTKDVADTLSRWS